MKRFLMVYENEEAKAWFSPITEYLSKHADVIEAFSCQEVKLERNCKVIYVKPNKNRREVL